MSLQLSLVYSEQYDTPAVVIPEDATRNDGDEILEFAEDNEAIYDSDDAYFVVKFPGRPIECYTERALLRSLNKA